MKDAVIQWIDIVSYIKYVGKIRLFKNHKLYLYRNWY